ncbi:MAG: LamG domain-containing protein [Lentisphaerae bacterium]|nr:LamG domain-containing protein [Lentisphaerota bacterium]
MNIRTGSWIIAMMIVISAAHLARAAITVDAHYRLGENDPGAAAGTAGQNPTLDSNGAFPLSIGTGSPSNITATSSSAIQRTGSTLAMTFTNGSYYVTNAALSTLNDNIGLEAWFRPDTTNGSQIIAANGGIGNAFGLWLQNGVIKGYNESGYTANSGITLATDTWYHAAFVVTNGVGCIYVNGARMGSTGFYTPPVPSGAFTIGAYKLTGDAPFSGAVDEVRLFHFNAGEFHLTDLLHGTVPSTQPFYTDTVLADNPVVYLPMGELDGPGLFDLVSAGQTDRFGTYRRGGSTAGSVQRFDPVATNGPGPATFLGFEVGNQASYFNGDRSGANAGATTDWAAFTSPTLGTDYSVEFWFLSKRSAAIDNITGYMLGRGTTDYDVLGIGGTYNGAPLTGSQGKLFAYCSGGQAVVGTTSLALDTWYHAVFVRSGTTGSLYLNGALENSGTMSVSADSDLFTFGNRSNDHAWSFQGSLDEVAIYDGTLTPSQVLAHYEQAVQGLIPDGTVVTIR